MSSELRALVDCLGIMKAAIEAGDWVIDGACDPDPIMDRAAIVLERNGWQWNKDTGWEAPK